MIHGILVVDKEEGPTSRKVVDLVRRALKEKKAGHLGTLDPMATGVLPVCLGKATRLARFLSGRGKTYEGVFLLGETSDTLDRTGQILTRTETPPTLDYQMLSEALMRFEGTVDQVPPMYSARKIGGTRLYRLARQGVRVERQPRSITIHRLELLNLEGRRASFRLSCSTGTYVRALARDLGEVLGCGALLDSLRRTAAEPFSLSESVNQSRLEGDYDRDSLLERLIPLESIDLGFPRITLDSSFLQPIFHGNAVPVPDSPSPGVPAVASGFVSVHHPTGALVAVARVAQEGGSMLHPVVVVAELENLID